MTADGLSLMRVVMIISWGPMMVRGTGGIIVPIEDVRIITEKVYFKTIPIG